MIQTHSAVQEVGYHGNTSFYAKKYHMHNDSFFEPVEVSLSLLHDNDGMFIEHYYLHDSWVDCPVFKDWAYGQATMDMSHYPLIDLLRIFVKHLQKEDARNCLVTWWDYMFAESNCFFTVQQWLRDNSLGYHRLYCEQGIKITDGKHTKNKEN